jgi:type VII secretion protein EccE
MNMKPMVALGVVDDWWRLVAVFVADVAILVAGSTTGRVGWWTAVGVAVVVTVAALITRRRAPLLTLTTRLTGLRLRPPRIPLPEVTNCSRNFGGGPAGIRAVGPHLVAVIAVDGPAHSPSVLDHHQVKSMVTLPLDVVAAGLRQCDVKLDGIDVISAGVRRAPKTHHQYAPVYSSRVGDHPAVGQRRTWLVVRFSAFRSVPAVMWRESVAATLVAATETIAQELTGRRCAARVLSAEQIAEMDEALLAGVDPKGRLHCGWGRLRHGAGYVHTYWLSPRDVSSANIDRLWTPDTDATVVTVQLRPTVDGAATVGVLVRYHTGGPLRQAPLTGLNPFTGRHDLGLVAGLAMPTGVPLLPSRHLGRGEHLSTPIRATGIIVGTTTAGHPLLVDLAAPRGVANVTVAGELALTVQLAMRAAATGYQVLVHTNRPKRWHQTVATGLALVTASAMGDRLPESSRPWLVVFDQVGGAVPQGAAVSVRTVERESGSGADIHLEQDDDRSASIRTWEFSQRLRIDLDYERRMIARDELSKDAA